MNWENCLILELKIFLKFREVVKTPVLFITFVRPDYARKTFDSIRAAQPSKLYFYSNKGRIEKEGEIERNEEIRSLSVKLIGIVNYIFGLEMNVLMFMIR